MKNSKYSHNALLLLLLLPSISAFAAQQTFTVSFNGDDSSSNFLSTTCIDLGVGARVCNGDSKTVDGPKKWNLYNSQDRGAAARISYDSSCEGLFKGSHDSSDSAGTLIASGRVTYGGVVNGVPSYAYSNCTATFY